jgi:multicomponent Na+:H+ antiporter subunit E
MIFWIIMSGYLDAMHIGFGVISVSVVLFFNYRLQNYRFSRQDIDVLHSLRFSRAFYFFFWLFVQIIVAGFHMARLIVSPSMPIRPAVVKFRADLPSDQAKMILGNSITLTPGTLTVDIEEDQFLIHALDTTSYESLQNDKMPREVLKLFEKEERQVISEFQIIENPEELA